MSFKRIPVYIVLILRFYPATAQNDLISPVVIQKHLNFLASDSLKGRGNFSPELMTAANYIEIEFAKANLQPLNGFFDFAIPFNGGVNKVLSRDNVDWNAKRLNQNQFFYFTGEKFPDAKTLTDFKLIEIDGALDESVLYKYWDETSPVLLWWKGNSSKDQKINSEQLKVPDVLPFSNVLLVSSKEKPVQLKIYTDDIYRKNVMFNLTGVLKGKTKPSEIVIFSAHYDHLGTGAIVGNDFIYNGANDNASGVAALLSLAAYYAEKNNNERTLVFCAFAGEEMGLLGSYNFAEIIKAETIKAGINLEMLGKAHAGQLGNFFITGEKFSDLKKIMQNELSNAITDEPNANNLFKRSDNYPFAMKGVPAHSILSSTDISDSCYHKPCDEIKEINTENISLVLKNVITGVAKIVSGNKTPKRISPSRVGVNL
jgi:hypothetical protein